MDNMFATNLPVFNVNTNISKLRESNDQMRTHIANLEFDIEKLAKKAAEIRTTQDNMDEYVLAMIKSAINDINSKDQVIAELQWKLEDARKVEPYTKRDGGGGGDDSRHNRNNKHRPKYRSRSHSSGDRKRHGHSEKDQEKYRHKDSAQRKDCEAKYKVNSRNGSVEIKKHSSSHRTNGSHSKVFGEANHSRYNSEHAPPPDVRIITNHNQEGDIEKDKSKKKDGMIKRHVEDHKKPPSRIDKAFAKLIQKRASLDKSKNKSIENPKTPKNDELEDGEINESIESRNNIDNTSEINSSEEFGGAEKELRDVAEKREAFENKMDNLATRNEDHDACREIERSKGVESVHADVKIVSNYPKERGKKEDIDNKRFKKKSKKDKLKSPKNKVEEVSHWKGKDKENKNRKKTSEKRSNEHATHTSTNHIRNNTNSVHAEKEKSLTSCSNVDSIDKVKNPENHRSASNYANKEKTIIDEYKNKQVISGCARKEESPSNNKDVIDDNKKLENDHVTPDCATQITLADKRQSLFDTPLITVPKKSSSNGNIAVANKITFETPKKSDLTESSGKLSPIERKADRVNRGRKSLANSTNEAPQRVLRSRTRALHLNSSDSSKEAPANSSGSLDQSKEDKPSEPPPSKRQREQETSPIKSFLQDLSYVPAPEDILMADVSCDGAIPVLHIIEKKSDMFNGDFSTLMSSTPISPAKKPKIDQRQTEVLREDLMISSSISSSSLQADKTESKITEQIAVPENNPSTIKRKRKRCIVSFVD